MFIEVFHLFSTAEYVNNLPCPPKPRYSSHLVTFHIQHVLVAVEQLPDLGEWGVLADGRDVLAHHLGDALFAPLAPAETTSLSLDDPTGTLFWTTRWAVSAGDHPDGWECAGFALRTAGLQAGCVCETTVQSVPV